MALPVTPSARAREAELREEVAQALSHDLGGPLRHAKFFSGRLHIPEDPEQARALEFVRVAAERGAALLQGIVRFLRLDTEFARARVEPLELSECVAAALQRQASAIEVAGARVEVEALPAVVGCGPLLIEVFEELLENALKFRAERSPTIRVRGEVRSNVARVEVADDGRGIYAGRVASVLELGKRGVGDGEAPGCGVGLALCRRIVELHGGRLVISAVEGQETCVHMELPLAGA